MTSMNPKNTDAENNFFSYWDIQLMYHDVKILGGGPRCLTEIEWLNTVTCSQEENVKKN